IPLESFVIDALYTHSLVSPEAMEWLPEKAIPWLEKLVKSPHHDPELRSRARELLLPEGKTEGLDEEHEATDGISMPAPVGESGTNALASWVGPPAGDSVVGR